VAKEDNASESSRKKGRKVITFAPLSRDETGIVCSELTSRLILVENESTL
jgi:hypothetical protein